MTLCRRARLWGGEIPRSAARLALVHACANAAAAALYADREAARECKAWLGAATSSGASLAAPRSVAGAGRLRCTLCGMRRSLLWLPSLLLPLLVLLSAGIL